MSQNQFIATAFVITHKKRKRMYLDFARKPNILDQLLLSFYICQHHTSVEGFQVSFTCSFYDHLETDLHLFSPIQRSSIHLM